MVAYDDENEFTVKFGRVRVPVDRVPVEIASDCARLV
jgi:hypothetical protein